ncbi:MAG: hypothetical protein R3C14_28830 [Caldilineaceae bacterium]
MISETISGQEPGDSAAQSRLEVARSLWLLLCRTPLLAISGGAVGLLLICALVVRQLPRQLNDDPVAAARWLLSAREQYGAVGNVLHALGLFNVLYNPLLQLLIAIITLILLIRLGNMLSLLWRLRQAARWVVEPVATVGAPVQISVIQPLYRYRQAFPGAPVALLPKLQGMLRLRFADVQHTTVATAPYTSSAAIGAVPAAEEAESESTTPPATVTEERLFGIRNPWQTLLRPLLLLGFLLALMGVWTILLYGWEAVSPPLAPGDIFRVATRDIAFTYSRTVGVDTAALMPHLSVQIGSVKQPLALKSVVRKEWGQLTLRSYADAPALLVRVAEGAPLLARPGQPQHTDAIGLVFPSSGSEDSVVLADSVGLQIVRIGTDEELALPMTTTMVSPTQAPSSSSAQFMLEIYPRDPAQPVRRTPIYGATTETIAIDGRPYVVTFTPVPSMVVRVQYQPGNWLLWLALLLALVGLVGFGYQPAFVLIQLAPWPNDRSVVVLQSDTAAETQALQAQLAALGSD